VSVDTTLGDGFAQGLRYDSNGFSRQTARAGFGAGCLTLKAETGLGSQMSRSNCLNSSTSSKLRYTEAKRT
jgi:hypothetical protein